jgi:hypothetical protein
MLHAGMKQYDNFQSDNIPQNDSLAVLERKELPEHMDGARMHNTVVLEAG